MLVELLFYRFNPVLQVLNHLMLKDIFNNVLAGKPFEPLRPTEGGYNSRSLFSRQGVYRVTGFERNQYVCNEMANAYRENNRKQGPRGSRIADKRPAYESNKREYTHHRSRQNCCD